MRPIPHMALSDLHVGLIYSLVLLALVQKTESTVDRPGEPPYRDVRDGGWRREALEDRRRW